MSQTFLLLIIFPHLNNRSLSFFHYFNLIDENSDDSSTKTVNNNNNNNNNNNINKSNEHLKIHKHMQKIIIIIITKIKNK